ncbi:MAG: Hsp70 family protein [Calditrichia bacterium]
MSSSPYIVGIDLGTTHCVLAYSKIDESSDTPSKIELMRIPQVVSPGEIKELALLPSFLLLPGPHDVPEGGLALPWDAAKDYAVGEYARSRGNEIPNRLVASAKSWLCHSGVDRRDALLPWNSGDDARRVSPIEATQRYLEHIRDAWNAQMAEDDKKHRLEEQTIYLTVPASFDAVARELTAEAASAAGLKRLTLLEEPQAAFYAWLEAKGNNWRNDVELGESILVCDVGGGTSDFSLIEVSGNEGSLELERAAVGEHILLGGDNMDLALAYLIRSKLAQNGTNIDDWQFKGLWHSCRSAKEKLLNNPEIETEPLVILGRGSSLIGGTIRSELTREEMNTSLVDGFFPAGNNDDFPQEGTRIGMREMGLPYAADAAVTRYLAHFLSKHSGETTAFPSAVLFNGGVMKAESFRTRVLEALSAWKGDTVRELKANDLDLAVAVGATYYGLAQSGKGIRIRAGAARAYYIGVESSMPAVPGIPIPINALNVLPFGTEEGTETDIRQREFGLIVGQPVVFHLLASTANADDKAGEIVEDWAGNIQNVSTMELNLPASADEAGGTIIPVWLQSKLTEVGTLELWCVSTKDDRRWKLEFSIRDETE